MGCRGGTRSVFTLAFRAKRTSLYISREKGVLYYIQTRHNDLFSPLQSFSDHVDPLAPPPGHPIILLQSN